MLLTCSALIPYLPRSFGDPPSALLQAVEPVDSKTRESLQKSVQLAIGITTQSQEAAARQEAERTEQEARGRLERQKIQDEALAEKARRDLLRLQVLEIQALLVVAS